MSNNDSQLRAIQSQIKENRRLLMEILNLVRESPAARDDGPCVTSDGYRFSLSDPSGTGVLDLPADRQRSPEVLAAIARDEAERI